MRDVLAALLITAAVALAGFGLWLGFVGPALSGAQGFAAMLFVAGGLLVLVALRVLPEREAHR